MFWTSFDNLMGDGERTGNPSVRPVTFLPQPSQTNDFLLFINVFASIILYLWGFI